MQVSLFLPVLDGAAKVLPDMPWHEPARLMLLAIAGQESGWTDREQRGGPAHSYWQLENEAVQAAMGQPFMPDVCALLDVPWDAQHVYDVIVWHDVLAAWCARTLLWMDKPPLPAVGDAKGAWECYLRVWRPGKPGPERWRDVYARAMQALRLPAMS